MQNIVVGITDSETSQVAGRCAFEMAERFGATVHVVTAVDAAEPVILELGSDSFVLDDVEMAATAMASFVQTIGSDVECVIHPIDGRPAKALLSVAEEVDADLIVVGNVRMQGIGRVLGSVGDDVLHHANCSVLIVKTV